ncbi:sugar ABC transporter substrate-binding protein [Paractinoplanes durhamensis]|uniref:ABC transporter substrate-binding protein n=1 Tax=Paractinoplanes durhamensis TaxID=113563 RepID=A0ABQ3ZAS3_9ACTN|nr:ABC transporter substrate-binding protein [Actinoplanes durhamensis]GIE06919.1 ABC transporter substrate-binding protein [Actinoplanes durhamensis]
MRNKRALAALASVALTGLLVSGCGNSDDSSASGPVDLTVWTGFTGGDAPGYDEIVADFNAAHPDIKVTMTKMSWDTIQQKLPSAWVTGQGPDIAAPSSDPNAIAQYVKTNSVLPITNTGTGDDKVNTDQLAAELVKEFTYNDKLYAVPANYATLSLYYNKKLVSTPPTTVAELQEQAAKLTTGGNYGLVLADNNTIQMWPILQWLSGGDIVDSNNCSVVGTPAGIASLQPWVDLVKDKKISPVGLSGAEADSLFSAGKAAMEINGPWAAASYKTAGVDFGLATVPTGADGKSVTLGSTAPLAISAKTKHPQQAQQFLAYWTSQTAQLKFSKSTGFPPLRTDLSDNADLKADPTVSVFASQVSNARLYLPQVPNATKVDTDAYVPLIQTATRDGDVAGAAATAAKKINELTGCTQ